MKGIPGVKALLLEEYGVRLITYDLPGFGESDPHPSRNLNSSAIDMSYLTDAVGVKGKFWVVGHSGGSLHAWAALKYIPDRVAGMLYLAERERKKFGRAIFYKIIVMHFPKYTFQGQQ